MEAEAQIAPNTTRPNANGFGLKTIDPPNKPKNPSSGPLG